MLPKHLPWVLATLIVLSAGCDAPHKRDKKKQLSEVARDWCQTITASQVMPVYPLTEDLQPGDVFLVPMSVEEQRARFDDKGFLPLDYHLARLTPEGYADFYRDMFVVPRGTASIDFTRSLQRGSDGKQNWSAAPAVGFPTYGFSVSRSGGLNAGIPLSGVPIGMSLLNATQATGSVSIQKAHTIGLDVIPLSEQLDVWAREHAADLMPYARDLDQEAEAATQAADDAKHRKKPAKAGTPQRAYLRIVSRLFVTGAVDIAVADASSGAAGIDAGKPRPVDLLTPSAPNSLEDVDARRVENMRAAIATLNAQLAESLAPTRESGSNTNATPAEMGSRAAARAEELNTAREARQKELDEKKKTVAEKDEAAKADKEALQAANDALKEKRKALHEMSRDPKSTVQQREEAKKAMEAARKEADARSSTAALTDLAKAKGKADVAKLALDQVSEVVPGASLRVTSSSSRFVTMRQDFDPPLVIGYHGFDREILFSRALGVHLGPPVATQQQILDSKAPIIVLESNNAPRAQELRRAIRDSHGNDPNKIRALNDLRLKLYPQSREKSPGFGVWLQSAQEAEVELFMRAANIPVPATLQ